MSYFFTKAFSDHPGYFHLPDQDLDLDVKEHVGISKIRLVCVLLCSEHPVRRRAEAVRTALSFL